jgi:hypothetical protein
MGRNIVRPQVLNLLTCQLSRLALLLLLSLVSWAAVQAADVPATDVVLVLDNSGSMRKNDPDFLLKRAVSQFVTELQQNTPLAW